MLIKMHCWNEGGICVGEVFSLHLYPALQFRDGDADLRDDVRS